MSGSSSTSITLNCAGLTQSLLTSSLFGHRRGSFTGAAEDRKGVFEAADGGTILLDEVGDMPMEVQTALLRVLQEKEITRVGEAHPRKVDVRVVAATHRNLTEEVDAGRFRADLLYRLRVVRIPLPPLRRRREDIPLLAQVFLRAAVGEMGKPVTEISPAAMRRMVAYPWPGNVRELKSAIDYATIRCRGTVIGESDLPPELFDEAVGSDEPAWPVDESERLREALRRTGGNRTAAAKLLGVSRATFYRHMAQYPI